MLRLLPALVERHSTEIRTALRQLRMNLAMHNNPHKVLELRNSFPVLQQRDRMQRQSNKEEG